MQKTSGERLFSQDKLKSNSNGQVGIQNKNCSSSEQRQKELPRENETRPAKASQLKTVQAQIGRQLVQQRSYGKK